ncbi:MAG: aldo/keto reductase [Candidatus Aminicenantes bacterium]|nr:MAG: aldo/keto reductase [Candidatus Aminicenantes bacterium]
MNKRGISRRGFIGSSLAAMTGFGILGKNKLYGDAQTESADKPKIREYRTLGRTGFKVSDISLGAGNLNDTALLEAALDMGINYIDTAEHYGRGNSERTIGQVMKTRDRKSVFITTKLNLFMGKRDKEGLKARALRCLERLQLDYVDCLMIHMTPTADQVKHEPYHEAIRELKAEGKVRYTGLSSHGLEHRLAGPAKDPMEKVVLAAAEDGRLDVVLFVYNFIQKEQGEKILKACKDKKMGTTLMKTNPVRFYNDIKAMFDQAKEKGRKIPEVYVKMIEEYEAHAAKAEVFKKKYDLTSNAMVRDAAIKFCLSNPDVHAVCPTINTHEELENYVALSGQRLKPTESEMLAEYNSTFGQLYCRHACGECESACPHGIPVNTIMRYDHYFSAQGREKHALSKYASLTGKNAGLCTDCAGFCEQSCPHGIPIQGLLVMAHQTLTL